MNGASAGMNGEVRSSPPLARAARTAFALMILTIVSLNVVARIETRSVAGGDTITKIVFDEATSAASAIVVIVAMWPLLRRIYLWRPTWPLLVAALAANGLLVSVLHVVGLKRLGIACSCGFFDEFGYEMAKGMAFYVLMVGGLFLAPAGLRRAVFEPPPVAPLPSTPPPLPGADLIDLPDGRNRLRVSAHDIVAVASAGNYAEFRLTDGRRPLLRMTLSALERQLADQGLIRVHRSWIVNPAHVRAVRALPSGDRRLTLTNGDTAPASRRNGEAIERVLGAGRSLGRG
jgi:hypothetical protein